MYFGAVAESSDEELVARVEALEKRAMELSLSLQRARSSYAPQLASRASEVCRAATEKAVTDCKVDTASFEAFSSGELKKTACLAISEHVATDRSTSAQPPSFSRTVVAGRIEKIKHKACDMRRKAQNVLDTLRIIAESESEATVNITVDGEVVTLHNTFAESGDQCDNCSDEFKRPSTSPTPLFCAALSPHVTPRTRTRSRLLAISPVAKIALPQ